MNIGEFSVENKVISWLLVVIMVGGGVMAFDKMGKRVSIDDSVFSEDKEVLEDLLAAAVNDAVRKVEARNREAMSGLASGFNLPAGFKLPF
jgi:DNA-binding protein YbaB